MTTNPTNLQFDNAEYEQPPGSGATCIACKQPIIGEYFETHGRPLCPICKAAIDRELRGGLGIVRFFRAFFGGLVGAIVGAGIYFAVAKLTGYELGLIAIVVGLVVGVGVRWGCGGRGGWLYQAMAMVLTYFAIIATHVPKELEYKRAYANYVNHKIVETYKDVAKVKVGDNKLELNGKTIERSEWQNELARLKQSDGAVWYYRRDRFTTKAPPIAVEFGEDSDKAGIPTAYFSDEDFQNESEMLPSLSSLPREVATVIVIEAYINAMLDPFFNIKDNIIRLVIIGIALYEAWKINKRRQLTITGPYRLAPVSNVPPTAPLARPDDQLL